MIDTFVIVDGHEDLSIGALADGRNYLGSARNIRTIEEEAQFANPNGVCMLGLAEWLVRARRGHRYDGSDNSSGAGTSG